MNANDVIDTYVNEVALRLPRKQRRDVAFELRALLSEELHAKAEAAGRAADAAMAINMLQAFGRPVDVAARYRPGLVIIDPADGHSFMRAALVGLLIIWSVGLFAHLRQPIHGVGDALRVLMQWWGDTVLASLWWPGVLVAGYASAAWAQRRWPAVTPWELKSAQRIVGGRGALVLGVIGIVCGACLLLEPRWLLDIVWRGQAAPGAYAALTYTDTVLARQAPVLLALIVLNLPLYIAVLLQQQWTVRLRQLDTGLALLTCVAMVWTVLDGPIFMAAESDRTAKFIMVLIVIFTLTDMGVKWLRKVRPAPNIQKYGSRSDGCST